MNCRDFETWLDHGCPEHATPRARDHAASCSDCAAALRDADEWEHALSQRFAVAPEGLTDRVMARLPARTDREAVSIPEDRESPWPWWIQILFEPAAALGLILGVLYAVAAPMLIGSGQELAPPLIERISALAATLPEPVWLHGLAGRLTLLAVAMVMCVGLFRGSIALFGRLTQLRLR